MQIHGQDVGPSKQMYHGVNNKAVMEGGKTLQSTDAIPVMISEGEG